MKLYTYQVVDQLLSDLNDKGYDCVQVKEGVLGSGNWICVPPTENKYYFVIQERYVNGWTSGHSIRRCSKLSKHNQEVLERMAV